MMIERVAIPPKPDQALVPQSVHGNFPPIDLRQRSLWLAVRQALLMVVDAIEVFLDMERTSEIRKRTR